MRMIRAALIICIACGLVLAPQVLRETGSADSSADGASKWIMIGDSYSRRPLSDQSRTWPRRLQQLLGIDDEDIEFFCGSGYGFVRSDKRFYTEIKKMESDDAVRYIVIQSGPRNDRDYSKKTIRKWMKKTDKLLRSKFPQAKIYYACPNWNIKKKDQKMLRQRKKWYKSIARECGWGYMGSVQNIYVNDSKWYEKDGHHPNSYGAAKLAKAMYRYLKPKIA